ncbi:MAG: PorV/PorQ family protein [candidate division KSB1 bacterium]|nr:PorV/PorQ family protein [candidate division KSB1 bacterium]
MNKSGKLVPLIIMVLLFTLPAHAGGVKKIAQTGMKWLSIPVGARATALGGAYTALVNDASSIFWNPAGMALAEGRHIFLSQNRWIADITINAGALVYNADDWGVFGASFSAVDWGTIHGTQRASTATGFVETGDFSPTDWALGVSYARRMSTQFSFGANVKFVHEKLGETLEGTFDSPRTFSAEMSLVAFDIGTLYYTGFKDLRFGMSLQNFSQEKAYRAESFPLPLTFKFGLAMNVFNLWMDQQDHNLTVAIDALHPRDYSERLHFGCEYSFKNILFLRGGYKTNYDEEDLAFGAGLLFNISGMGVGLDYSYLQFKNFDAVHTFSFDFKF